MVEVNTSAFAPVPSEYIYYDTNPSSDYIYSFNSTGLMQKDFTNDYNDVASGGENEVDSLPLLNSKKIEFISFLVVSMICDILNCGTVAVIFQHKRIRRVNYLIANLSLVCIMMSIVCIIYVGDRTSVLQQFNGIFLCRILSFARNLFVSVISLTVFAISYERIRSLQSHIGQLLIKRTLAAIWGVSIVLMIPTLFARIYVHEPPDSPKCKKVPIFGMVGLAILFEACRFTLFHVSVCAYMVFELYKIRSKMRYLYLFRKFQSIPSQNLLQKIQRIRFIYIFSISFIFVWFPSGAVMSLLVLQHRQGTATNLPDLTVPVLILLYVYLMLVPIIVLLTNEDISKVNLCCNRRDDDTEPEISGGGDKDDGNIVSAEVDLAETFAVTSCEHPVSSQRSNQDNKLVLCPQNVHASVSKNLVVQVAQVVKVQMLSPNCRNSKDSIIYV